MKKTILIVVLLMIFAVAGINLITSGISAAMSDNQCYQMASNKDNALANMGGELQWSGSRVNPCTGESDTADTYYDLGGGVTQMRTVYGNGDADGYIGLTRYWVCQNGRAKVYQRIYGPIWGRTPWGFWWNFPFDDDPSTWVRDKKICNTME